MQNNRWIGFLLLGTALFFGAAFVTLRAAEQAGRHAAAAATKTNTTPSHPPLSAPEESATITDDPTTAPDPSQSADNNVSFPTDI